MNDVKAGIHTTEFWVTAVVNLVGAIVAVLSARGLLAPDEGTLWVALAKAIAIPVIGVALAYVNGKYIEGRVRVKEAAANREVMQARMSAWASREEA